VALAHEIAPDSSVALDTDALIYFVEEHQLYRPVIEPVIVLVSQGHVRAHISVINLLEVLVQPLRLGRYELTASYRQRLTNPDDFVLHSVTTEIAERAAAIRAEFRIEVADAIVAASAIEAGCDYLITNNREDFKNVTGLRLLVIDDFVTN
jgi:predicted nucleic acid-binding protein